ncbi:protein JTB isoform X3 [Dicentrarchus labrax]|uniref:protein JTB isoform X3 n=1 Tax=Dicentrarchus labrax TaxID=13489 RepID=UPI0021F5E576|nr:protein JTB isoform X3 [Dicentrarchus labrax]
MESDCRIPVACCRPRVLVLHALFWGLVSLRVFGAALLSDSERTSAAVKAVAAPCWLLEDFVVTTECGQCNAFQTRSWSACEPTGYVERVNCTRSNRDEYKRSHRLSLSVRCDGGTSVLEVRGGHVGSDGSVCRPRGRSSALAGPPRI